jgi:hypothetical protein
MSWGCIVKCLLSVRCRVGFWPVARDHCHPITGIVLSELFTHWGVCVMEKQWVVWDPKEEGHLISSKNRWFWLIKRPPTDVSAVWGYGAVSLDGWSLTFWDCMVVSSARVNMFTEKHEKAAWTIWPQKTRPQHCLRTMGTSQSMTCHHIPDLNCTTAKA